MSNLQRIKWIDGEIRNHVYSNCRKICEKFEISNRQALRDRFFKGFSEPGSYFLSIGLSNIKSVKLTNQSFNKYSPSILHKIKKY